MQDGKLMLADLAAGTGVDQPAHLREEPLASRWLQKPMVGSGAHHVHVLVGGKVGGPYVADDPHVFEISAVLDLLARVGNLLRQRRRPAGRVALADGGVTGLNFDEERVEARRKDVGVLD
jgi:hypothetical protein